MPQTKILLDTNAYLRLAQTIHPLLFVPFGDNDYTLYVIKEFHKEFNRAKRLTRNFPWVNLKEFKENRSKSISLSKEDKKKYRNCLVLHLES
jgi:protein-arginine kinase